MHKKSDHNEHQNIMALCCIVAVQHFIMYSHLQTSPVHTQGFTPLIINVEKNNFSNVFIKKATFKKEKKGKKKVMNISKEQILRQISFLTSQTCERHHISPDLQTSQ